MKKIACIVSMCAALISVYGEQASDCKGFGQDVQQFSMGLSAQNKTLFCGQFTESQRATAMQMVGQPDENGNPMTADQSVQKVAATTTMQPSQQKTPAGCPVK